MNIAELELAGVNVDSFMGRIMNNASLIPRFMGKFLEDNNYAELLEAIEENDMTKAASSCHAMKGMCGNLSMDRLYELFSEQMKLFRAGENEKAIQMMGEITVVYDNTVNHVKKALGE